MRCQHIGAASAALMLGACLHHRDVVECTHHSTGTECWESSRHDAQGRLRHVVIEHRSPGAPCDAVRVEQAWFDEHGLLLEHEIEERKCDVVDLRMVDRYDLFAHEVQREISIDLDHDDQFDRVVEQRLPLTAAQERRATEQLDADARELKAAHAREHRPR